MKHDYQIILKKGWHGQNYGDPIIPKVLDLYKHDTKSGSYMNLWLQNQVAMWWVRRTGHRAERIPPLKSNHQFNDLTFTWNIISDIARYDIFRPKFKEPKKYHGNTMKYLWISIKPSNLPCAGQPLYPVEIQHMICNHSRRLTPYSCRARVCNDFEVMSRTVQQAGSSTDPMRRWGDGHESVWTFWTPIIAPKFPNFETWWEHDGNMMPMMTLQGF